MEEGPRQIIVSTVWEKNLRQRDRRLMVAPKDYNAAGCSVIILASCLLLDPTLETM